jgi:hypothetical protein
VKLSSGLGARGAQLALHEMVKKLWGMDADPLAHKGDWEKCLAKVSKQSQFRH